MQVLVSGATGLIGSRLVPRLRDAGHRVLRLSRTARGDDVVRVEPDGRGIDLARCAGTEAVVHLAGEAIAGGRWTDARMRRIRDSRVEGTGHLVEQLAKLEPRPRVWIGASAVGYYGDRGDEVLTAASAAGSGFIAEVCVDWEAASEPVEAWPARRVLLRTGLVLAAEGGALKTMSRPFRLGLGGVIGDGRQWWSWIAIDDLTALIERALSDERTAGALEAVAPTPVTCREFTKTLGRVLHRPTILPVPAGLARLALGRMADPLVLASARVVPERTLTTGFRFGEPVLETALRRALSAG